LKRHWLKKHKTIAKSLISELDIDGATFSKAGGEEVKNEEDVIKSEDRTETTDSNAECSMIRLGDIDIPPQIISVPCVNIPPPLV